MLLCPRGALPGPCVTYAWDTWVGTAVTSHPLVGDCAACGGVIRDRNSAVRAGKIAWWAGIGSSVPERSVPGPRTVLEQNSTRGRGVEHQSWRDVHAGNVRGLMVDPDV